VAVKQICHLPLHSGLLVQSLFVGVGAGWRGNQDIRTRNGSVLWGRAEKRTCPANEGLPKGGRRGLDGIRSSHSASPVMSVCRTQYRGGEGPEPR
jgi:hypothetical protein